MTPPHLDPVWIASDQELAQCCHSLRAAAEIAVDTEFMRSSTFYPKAALIQLYAGEDCYLVDPLSIGNFSPLVELLTDRGVVKVFHACSEDLEVFNTFLGCIPEPLVDTQIAAGLLEYGSSSSYAALVEAVLEVKLEKGETRSDWLQRPLAARQLQYAVQDVVYLLPLYHALIEELEAATRIAWLQEDCESLVANAKSPQDLDAFYPRIKSAWKLNRRQLAVLRELSYWREQEARERDLPRNHVLHERVLWNLASQQPRDMDSLRSVEGMEPRKLRRFGKDVLAVIARAANLKGPDLPAPLPGPLPIAQRDLMKAFKAVVEERAEELGIVPEVLAKKADFDFILRSGMNNHDYELPRRLRGWRQTIVGESLLQVVADTAGKSLNQAGRCGEQE